MGSITDINYWEEHWGKVIYKEATITTHPVALWINNNTPTGDNLKCLEIGCYPGKFLALIGKMGYEINGVDWNENINVMEEWFKSKNYKCGVFQKNDFLNYRSFRKYDLVCSFGFIEHFNNWTKIIDKHLNLMGKNGICLIEVPNLNSPLYHFLYKILEPKVLENHISDAMSLNKIKRYIRTTDHNLTKADYVGHFYFRFVTKKGRYYSILENVINFFGKILDLLPKNISARYIGFVIK